MKGMTMNSQMDSGSFPISFPNVPDGLMEGWVQNEYEETHDPDDGSIRQHSLMEEDELASHVSLLKRETTVNRYHAAKKSEEVLLQVLFETFQIKVKVKKSKGAVSYINIGDIHEIRVGNVALRSKEFATSSEIDQAVFMNDTAICIMHGTAHRLKQFVFTVDSEDEWTTWTEGLKQFTRSHASSHYTSDKVKERWLMKSWEQLTPSGVAHITLRELKTFLTKSEIKLSSKETKDHFMSVDTYKEGKINFAQFVELYHELCEDMALLQQFDKYSTDPARAFFSHKDVVAFYKKEMSQTVTEEWAANITRRYGRTGKLKVPDLIDYLISNENEAWYPERKTRVYEDMTRPLTHYFMASSHNTYLMGDQFRSESSVEAYVRALRDGCRCVEIDSWDGPTGDPIVYHGHTLTSRIKFRDVVTSITEHAFAASKYPVVLSLENHCSSLQQQIMADVFKKEFRDLLCYGFEDFPESHERGEYPSPEDLCYRVILKHKKLKPGETEVATGSSKDTEGEDLSDATKNGFLRVQEVDTTWTRQYFVLTQDKLAYADNKEFEDQELEAQKAALDEEMKGLELAPGKETELHYAEPWFHGALMDGTESPNGRAIAERRMYEHMKELEDGESPDGMFMVRESTTYAGEFSLSFWRESAKTIEHCRIRHNGGTFCITPKHTFQNLFELVEYYKAQPLVSPQWSAKMKIPIPQPPDHMHMNWYHESITRQEAETMLKQIPADGAFLVRSSSTEQGALSISFRAEGKIKHCRVTKESRLYVLGTAEFPSMCEMIQYYELHPLYKRMKLRFAVDDALLRSQGVAPPSDEPEAESMYFIPPAPTKEKKKKGKKGKAGVKEVEDAVHGTGTARSTFAYKSDEKDELSFPLGAIISCVEEVDGGWWSGNYGKAHGWFPSNYVLMLDPEIIADEMGANDAKMLKSGLGELQKWEMSVEGMKVEVRPSIKTMRLVFRITNVDGFLDVGADDPEDVKSWSAVLTEAGVEYAGRAKATEKKVAKMKIAPDLSDLIFYFTSVHFKDFATSASTAYQQMSSFGENSATKYCSHKGNDAPKMTQHTIRNFARVYPKGTRVNSSNYDPQLMWNCGIQVVALNYQTPDRLMWLNDGKFTQNGRSGYTLKPNALFDTKNLFDPFTSASWTKKVPPVTMKIKILSGRHLLKPGKGIASPYVHVEVSGVGTDASSNIRRTKVVQNNGFRPRWDEVIMLELSMPELACITFTIFDEDQFGDSNAIGQATIPVGTKTSPMIRNGYRSVQLKNIYNFPEELSALLIHVEINYGATKHSTAMLKLGEQLRELQETRYDMVKIKMEEAVLDVDADPGPPKADPKLDKLNLAILDMEKKILAMI
jgi:phosphatidylinositol phospholipase C gamma-1